MSQFVILEIAADGYVAGDWHKPRPKTGRGGMTLHHFPQGEIPLWWPAVCGVRGKAYMDAPVLKAYPVCRECG